MEHTRRSETRGVGFELKSRPPPHALAGSAGVQAVEEVLRVLTHLGVQAGPSSGLHVHVDVGKPGAWRRKESDLSLWQIAQVYVQYAKWQLVIDEMLTDSRIGNSYARELLVAAPRVFDLKKGKGEVQSSNEYFKPFFWRLWTWFSVREERPATVPRGLRVNDDDAEYVLGLNPSGFCRWVTAGRPERVPEWQQLVGWESDNPCEDRYPDERHQQVNLAVLDRLGTIEFRAFPATNDGQRARRWVEFVLRFVETMKDEQEFFSRSPAEDLFALTNAQKLASLKQLEAKLGVDMSYWRQRSWLKGPACEPHGPPAAEPDYHFPARDAKAPAQVCSRCGERDAEDLGAPSELGEAASASPAEPRGWSLWSWRHRET